MVSGYFAITPNVSCSRKPIGGAATLYPTSYAEIYTGVTYGIGIKSNSKTFNGWVSRGDGSINANMYSNAVMNYVVICE